MDGPERGQYLNNGLSSPRIPMIGSGPNVQLKFDVYLDMPLDAVVVYDYSFTTWADNCPSGSHGGYSSFYFGGQKQWRTVVVPIDPLINFDGVEELQIHLQAADYCGVGAPNAGNWGSGACHSHAPLFDAVHI